MNKQKRKNQIHLQVLILAQDMEERGRSKEIEISFPTMTSKKYDYRTGKIDQEYYLK